MVHTKKRKRFGKSLFSKSPALLVSIIDRKLGYLGNKINKVDTNTFKASQYNHISDTFEKKTLSVRITTIGEKVVQRDLYSAFLLMNSKENLKETDRTKCLDTFGDFIINESKCINEIKKLNIKRPHSFGF